MRKFVIGIVFLPLILLIGCGGSKSSFDRRAQKGILDLNGWNPISGYLELSGDWSFYPESYLDPALFSDPSYSPDLTPDYEKVPGEWNSYETSAGERGGYGYGTYTLRLNNIPRDENLGLFVREQGTAYSLFYCDSSMTAAHCREPLLKNGKPGTDSETTIPQLLPVYSEFHAGSITGSIVIHIANFHHRQGGLWENILFGQFSGIRINQEYNKAVGYISLGIILIMGIYHLGLFSQRKEDRGSLFFGLFCLDLSVRVFVTERILQAMFPESSTLSFEVFYKMEYFTFFTGTALFTQFFHEVFQKFISKYFIIFIWIASLAFAAQLFFPVSLYSRTTAIFQLITLSGFIYAMIGLVRARKEHVSGSTISLFGFSMLFITFINDILYTRGAIPTTYMLQYGFLFFIFSQSMILSTRFSLAFRESESLRKSLARFVPTQFVSFLEKESIIDVEAGDGVKKDLTVLFLDIRGFTSMSEGMTTEENFRFLNSFLKRMSPHIHTYNGFVDKFMGDAIMALFPEPPSTAIQAAVDMQKELTVYNRHRANKNYPSFRMGIGIHSGELMLGTVGTSDRLDTTVIGDTVNLASRLEDLTKTYGSSVIISEDIYRSLKPEQFMIREIDTVRVRGRSEPVRIFEVFDSDPPEIISLKKKTSGSLKQGIELFRIANYAEALEYFDRCLAELPDDHIAIHYRDICRRNIPNNRK